MNGFIAWCGFIGAWLLFAGPVYQAALELREQEVERDRIAAASATVAKPAPISNWWWLLPPVHYVLTHRKSATYRQAVFAVLDTSDIDDLLRYMTKAIGWLLVGLGGLLLAVSETWDLTEHYAWPVAVFWILVIVMAAMSAVYTFAAQGQGQKLLRSLER